MDRRRLAFAALAALLLLAAAGLLLPERQAAPLERAEIYFVDGARAMVETGDYLVPRYRGEAFFDKPPLTYWLIAASFASQGFTPRAARLVPALAALLTLAGTLGLGTLLLGRRTALAGGVILATSLAFLSFGRLAMSDMLLTAFTTLALALAVAAFRPGGSPALWPALAAALGLGFLTKGPIGLLLPAFGVVLLWRQRGRPRVGVLPLALAAVLLAVLSVSWFVAVYARLGWGPLEYFFLRENLQRFAGETYDTGLAPWFYLGAYLAEGLPWSPLLPLALPGAFRAERPAEVRAGIRLLALWLVLAALPLALSRGKIDYYLLPLYPAASLLIATLFDGVAWGRLQRVWIRSLLVVLAIGIVVLVLYPVRVPKPWLPAPSLRTALVAAALALAAALLAVAWRPRPWRVLAALGGTMAALTLGVQTFFLPAFRTAQPNLAIVRAVAREQAYRPEVRVALCTDPARVQRDILFLVRLAAEEHCDLWDPASARVPFLLLLTRGESEALETIPGIRTVGVYRYLPATALTSGGLWRRYAVDELVLMANYPTQEPRALARQKREKKRAIRERWDSGAQEEEP